MGKLESSFHEQQKLEDLVNLKAMVIQVGVSLFFAIAALVLFSWLRPKYGFIYAPKTKLSKSDIRRPTVTIGSGWLDWIKPVFRVKDDALLQNIGFDAFAFIYFTRMLRQLTIILGILSMFVLLPINIVATYNTGDWPPAPGLDFMSIASMNYQYGKESQTSNFLWYWSPTLATWIFSAIVFVQVVVSSERFLKFRKKKYCRDQQVQLSTSMSPDEMLKYQELDFVKRTLLVQFEELSDTSTTVTRKTCRTQQHYATNADLKGTVDSMSEIPCQDVFVGKYNPRIHFLLKSYHHAIQSLEKHMAVFMHQVKQESLKWSNSIESEEFNSAIAKLKRPRIQLDWKSMKKVDAINHYTEQCLSLSIAIRRCRSKLQDCTYGWAVFSTPLLAQKACTSINSKQSKPIRFRSKQTIQVCPAPTPEDIIWSNMNIDKYTAKLKWWFGYGLFFSVVFFWSIPMAGLAVSANSVNLVRLFKQADKVIRRYQLLLGLIQSLLTPLLMIICHVGLPELLGIVSRQQAYKTNTRVEQEILWKLYMFFVMNNLVIFTLVNIMLGTVGQITALVLVGTLKSNSISEYVFQVAKNMSDLSSFWINYVCLRSVGIMSDLVQLLPLLFAVVLPACNVNNHRLTPRQMRDFISVPPTFHYAKNYGLVISFFTAALVYSVAAPIVLPFAIIYFSLATAIFKHKMMYIYVTKTETYCTIWPLLCRIVMISVIVFQLMMILMLGLKAGRPQSYTLIPLPSITLIATLCYLRRLNKNNTPASWMANTYGSARPNVAPSAAKDTTRNETSIELEVMDNRPSSSQATTITTDTKLINSIYSDPSLTKPLQKPLLSEDLRYLVPLAYNQHPQREKILQMLYDIVTEPNTNNAKLSMVAGAQEDNNHQITVMKTDISEQLSPSLNKTLSEKEEIKAAFVTDIPSVNPRSIPYYFDEQHYGGGGSSSSGGFDIDIIYQPALVPNLLSPSQLPSAPTLEEMLNGDDSIVAHNSVAVNDIYVNVSPQVFYPSPPDYAEAVLPRTNTIQHLTRQKQRRHSA